MNKEEEKIKEVNSRSVRRKAKKGNVNKNIYAGRNNVQNKKPAPKVVVKEEEKKEEPKKEVKETKKTRRRTNSNKAPYLFFTVISILYFAISICLIGYGSYKAIAVARAGNNNSLNQFVQEKIVNDSIVFDEDNLALYQDNRVNNAKVICYYFIVLFTFVISSFLLAVIFSYLSEFFTDKVFDNPFKNPGMKLIRKCAYLSVIILCISTISVFLQKYLTPFNATVIAIESVFIISISSICGYLILERGNELIKE
ncbi:MAG: hypothetical protein J6X02_04105 [Bacilli bacterium]|nr:hypothetical protein [Bacilli bacterium]